MKRTQHNGRYYGKLMLFGEYSIINKSKALTVPLKHYSGELSFIPDNKYTLFDYAKSSNQLIRNYAKYLENAFNTGELDFSVNIRKLLLDLEAGLYFDSSIPQGYGAGSSGALIAALYDQYVTVPAREALQLRNQFSFLENFFHGRSSGIDPLVAWYQQPLLIEVDDFSIVDKPNFTPSGKEALFLVDTEQTGKTQPMVELFLDQMKKGEINAQYLTNLNNSIIDSLLQNRMTDFEELMKILSAWQFKNMPSMIPDKMLDFWQKGLDNGKWFTKLCGSGGGGFLLGYTNDYHDFAETINGSGYRIIPVQVPEMAAYKRL